MNTLKIDQMLDPQDIIEMDNPREFAKSMLMQLQGYC
jgi:hypothetical protein